jgi:hypothetical protein
MASQAMCAGLAAFGEISSIQAKTSSSRQAGHAPSFGG